MSDLLHVDSLRLQLPQHDQPLLRDVTLTIGEGEAVGLVGESGSGKSLTTRAVLRLTPKGASVSGAITYRGQNVLAFDDKRLRAWRATEVAIVFQDPRAHINPVRTVGDFLTEGIRTRNTTRRDDEKRAADLLADVGVSSPDRRLRQYPHQLSGGLLQRVMIASTLLRSPELLIADEPTTALDVTTQSEVMAIIDELRRDRGMALLFITHDLDLASAVCDRIGVMYAGSVVENAAAEPLLDEPAHPYTASLLQCRPELGDRRKLRPIPGRPISGIEVEAGCAFTPRCPAAMPQCATDTPVLQSAKHGHVACHLWRDGHLVKTAEVPDA